ncbi:MAG TPA: DUF3788 domain-containing protein [Bacilli bacterium]|nr:DUF3788 domain-containing protein [Bacilli bacterium]
MEKTELENLVGLEKIDLFFEMAGKIETLYDMDRIWNNGGRKWNYEYKYRKGSKTLCAFYFKESVLGFMIIFGKEERNKVEEIRNNISIEVMNIYDEAETFHDGKWVMFNLENDSIFEDLIKLLQIKRRPNRR